MKALMYVCRTKPWLVKNEHENFWYTMNQHDFEVFKNVKTYNGYVVASFDFEVEGVLNNPKWKGADFREIFYRKSCLTGSEIHNYLNRSDGYAIHIKNLEIFEEAKELSNYLKELPNDEYEPVKRAPQNMMKVYYKYGETSMFDSFVLISVHSEWACKILNEEKTIELRKKVLKEMLEYAKY